MLMPGVRVIRGPDWSWGNQDGGEGFVGTVCEIGKSSTKGTPDKTVVVQWDNGNKTNYRVGYLNKFDLRIVDNAQIGVKHSNIVCDGCVRQGINGMRYKCSICHDYDLCCQCYHNNKHDLMHGFKRYDTATSLGVILPARNNAKRVELKGVFAGAKVVRGPNWEWNNQDGGDGKIGYVLDIRGWDNESSRSVANVKWLSGSTNVYRLGHKGNCDVKFVEPASGGWCYPEHLPILEQGEQIVVKPQRIGPPPFIVGDKVKVAVSEIQLKTMQQDHGGWNPRMTEYIGKIGVVHRVTDKGDIRVQYEGCNNRWTFNPITLIKVNSMAVGDIVTLINDVDKVKDLQKGHGEWIEVMRNSLGKLGKITKIYGDGDLRVQLDGQTWTLNPECVRIVPGSAAELANTMHATQNQREDPAMAEWRLAEAPTNDGVADELVRAAAQGHHDNVLCLLESTARDCVDAKSGGKTAMQVAAHQGHVNVVKTLLQRGASVNAVDNDGDSCLHYAAFGNQPEILELLIKSGSDLNAANRIGCTALHIAAHKQSKCVQVLLSAGVDPNRTDRYGDTALHDAIGKGNYQVIELLSAAPGTDFTLRNKRGFNVLHHAALKGKNYATRKLLERARQSVDVKKDDGFAALHLAALNGHRDVVETLVRYGRADVDLRNNRRQSALHLAVSQGHCGVVETLLDLGADIDARDEDEDTALHIVLLKRQNLGGSDSGICTTSLRAFATIDERLDADVEHRTAVILACYLVERAIDVDALNCKQQKALDLLSDEAVREMIMAFRSAPIVALDALHWTDDVSTDDAVVTSSSRPIECLVCSELSEDNVRLEPCNHRPACEDCSARMKKCLQCGAVVQRRTTKDGRIIAAKSRQPSAERMRYLECKIAEIEESHACSICMERKRNVVFLCGHGTCAKCADTLKTCHMCRKTITKKIPIY